MAYEFKKLSDVDTVETPSETANVLIEEDGVIKKAPKTAVGGNGSNEYDMIVRYEGEEEAMDGGEIECTVISGNFDTIFNKIKQGYIPKILLSVSINFIEYKEIYYNNVILNFDSCIYSYGGDMEYISQEIDSMEGMPINIYKDNTVTLGSTVLPSPI